MLHLAVSNDSMLYSKILLNIFVEGLCNFSFILF